jgi:hypothetical protein
LMLNISTKVQIFIKSTAEGIFGDWSSYFFVFLVAI